MSDLLPPRFSSDFLAAFLVDDPEELYEHAPCAYLSTTPDGTVIKANQTFYEWTGYTAEGLLRSTRWQDLLAPGDRIFYETHFATALRLQKQVREVALELVCEGGERLPILANAAMKLDADGNPLVVRIAMFDARERRAYEAELLAERRRAEAAERRAATLARTLQASLLPPTLLDVPGLDVGSVYRSAGDGSIVGGDFYDLVQIAPTSWAFVVGDVCGKGAEAAVLTALARDTIRTQLLDTDDPATVLTAVRDVMLRYHPDRFVAVVMCVLESADDGWELRTAAGGHQLPFLRRADGTVEVIGTPGTILGMLEDGRVHLSTHALQAGDALVLCTDGVTEARRDRRNFGEDGVEQVLRAGARRTAQDLADLVAQSAIDYQGGQVRDDIAVLTVRVD